MKSQRIVAGILCAIILVMLVFTPLVILAQEAPATTPPAAAPVAESEGTLWWLIKASGWIGILIIGCSVALVAFIIEDFVNLRRDKLIPPELLQEVEDLLEDENYEEIIETCTGEPGFLSNVISAALSHIDHGYDVMMATVHSVIDEEALKLYQKIGWLQLLASISPMLGLLGTVWGMVSAFGTIANMEGAPKPKDLAGGIYTALVTTVEGLLVAIPGIIFYFYFRNKVVRLTTEINGIVEELMERFREKK